MNLDFSSSPKHQLVVKTKKKELASVWFWPLLIVAFIGGAICGTALFIVDLFSREPKK